MLLFQNWGGGVEFRETAVTEERAGSAKVPVETSFKPVDKNNGAGTDCSEKAEEEEEKVEAADRIANQDSGVGNIEVNRLQKKIEKAPLAVETPQKNVNNGIPTEEDYSKKLQDEEEKSEVAVSTLQQEPVQKTLSWGKAATELGAVEPTKTPKKSVSVETSLPECVEIKLDSSAKMEASKPAKQSKPTSPAMALQNVLMGAMKHLAASNDSEIQKTETRPITSPVAGVKHGGMTQMLWFKDSIAKTSTNGNETNVPKKRETRCPIGHSSFSWETNGQAIPIGHTKFSFSS